MNSDDNYKSPGTPILTEGDLEEILEDTEVDHLKQLIFFASN